MKIKGFWLSPFFFDLKEEQSLNNRRTGSKPAGGGYGGTLHKPFPLRCPQRKESIMKQKGKRIAALICVILLVLLYVATLVVSLLDFEGSDQLFASCIVATIVLPILLWVYIWLYGKITRKDTIADLHHGQKKEH